MEQDRQVAERLKGWREGRGMDQETIATLLGLSRSQIANVESGRTPLRYRIGDTLCFLFGINSRWLATGKPPDAPHIFTPSHLQVLIKPFDDAPFAQVYHSFLARHVDAFMDDNLLEMVKRLAAEASVTNYQTRLSEFPAMPAWKILVVRVNEILGIFAPTLPSEMHAALLTKIGSACSGFLHENAAEIARRRAKEAATESTAGTAIFSKAKLAVDTRNEVGLDSADMTASGESLWDDLQKRVVAATEREGAKSELADFLNVSASAVSQLRTGGMKLDAMKTLLLLAWVTAEEAKQKSAVDVSASTAPKTQPRSESKHETKTKSGRRKR